MKRDRITKFIKTHASEELYSYLKKICLGDNVTVRDIEEIDINKMCHKLLKELKIIVREFDHEILVGSRHGERPSMSELRHISEIKTCEDYNQALSEKLYFTHNRKKYCAVLNESAVYRPCDKCDLYLGDMKECKFILSCIAVNRKDKKSVVFKKLR